MKAFTPRVSSIQRPEVCGGGMQDNDLRQSAVYGLGVAAQHRRDAFRPVAAQVGPAAPCTTLLLWFFRKPSLHTDHCADYTKCHVEILLGPYDAQLNTWPESVASS